MAALMKRILLILAVIAGYLVISSYMHQDSEHPAHKYRPEYQDNVAEKSSERPIIIWWTGRLFIRREMSVLKCGEVECAVTKKRRYLKDRRTRAMIFYGTDFAPDDLPLPRKAEHEWALVHEESPMNNQMFSHAMTLQHFNHSCTFRRESDVPITTHSLESLEYLTERQPVETATKNSYRKQGLAPLLYVQSHCNVASDRDSYVRELMKYIQVDSYGACAHNKDLPQDLQDPVESMFDKKFLDIIARYKFHLAFENALCDDYITEKLYRVFHVGAVPVYLGSRTARDWSPDREAIIMADDFKSPEELANFITTLDQDDERYNQYLAYKQNGITNENLRRVMETRTWGLNHDYLPFYMDIFECHVCRKVHERLRAEKEGRIMETRIVPYNHIGCPQPIPSVVGARSPKTSEPGMNWTSDYWSGLDKAHAMTAMIDSGETQSARFDEYWDRYMREKYKH